MLEYYGYLATRVAPHRLIGSAARRALRAARARLGPRGPTPSREELLAGFRCELASELSARLSAGHRGLVAAPHHRIGAALERHFPGELERLVSRADDATRGVLTIFGHAVDVNRPSGGTDWQLDPVHGGRYAAWSPSETLPAVPGCDPKMAWAVGRGDQWVALACGAIADPARGERYAEAFAFSVRDFVLMNPAGRGVQWASPMEAALRAVCLGQAHALLSGRAALLDPGYVLDATRLAITTARFVLARLEDWNAVPDGHLVANFVGLLACAAFVPEWPEAARWRALALAGLARELQAQTNEDGTSFEGSIPHHRKSLELFTAGALLARLSRRPLGAAFWRRLGAMFHAARGLLARGGEIPQLGDDDSGRVFTFRERSARDGAYLLPLAAAVMSEQSLRTRPGVADAEEVLWLLGADALERIAHGRPGQPPRSAAFPDGGFHALRRWPLEAFVSCGRNGQSGIGGHSHNDKLAFELRIRGHVAIADPGSPSYTRDPAERDAFRSTRAHATIVVDGEEQSPLISGRPFALPDAASASLLALESTHRRERFVGEHHAYSPLGVIHQRELVLGSAAVVVDRLLGAGRHTVELRFPFAGDARLRALSPAERQQVAFALTAVDLDPGDPSLVDLDHGVEIGPEAAPIALLAVGSRAGLTRSIEPALYSPGYGERVDARIAVFAARLNVPVTFVTVILPLASGDAAPFHVERKHA
ncbi:MAG TPA: alginate lyase family protein [Anaeromyxobacteraceae bacterium]|nr:alginate lyase family protein [Anaeromyxobacteraceae bacterium]